MAGKEEEEKEEAKCKRKILSEEEDEEGQNWEEDEEEVNGRINPLKPWYIITSCWSADLTLHMNGGDRYILWRTRTTKAPTSRRPRASHPK
ncbi:putative signaling protein [Dissostichus eleginoides]|uniref:Signaling protein n=1 Tax=Dissostichus eleginoides TaxID=100907 RepID=A0AAD9FAT7_DISEL|nr:putative signaling protein [Dissostichus eleginoides]